METWKEYYPIEWHDDESMDVLFSLFRDNRELNPHSWDRKLQFWSDMIFKETMYARKVSFVSSEVSNSFRRKGKTPKCLTTVLLELYRSGKIMSRSKFEASVNQGWLSWGFDWVVKKPVSWSFGKMLGSSTIPDGEYILLDALKITSDAVFKRVQDNGVCDLIEIAELANMCSDLSNTEALDLILLNLVKEKKAVVSSTEKGEKVVRFVTSKNNGPVTEIELKTLKLRKTETCLKSQVLELSDDMERCKNDARFYLKKGLRNSAKNALRRKQTLGRMLTKREVALETIQNMIEQIKEAESDKKILDAYKAGASAFKSVAGKHNLTTDNIEDIMTNVQEAFDMQSEINESMAYNPSESILDVTTADLEHELHEILAADSSANATNKSLSPVTEKPNIPHNKSPISPSSYRHGTAQPETQGLFVSDNSPPEGAHNRTFTLNDSDSLNASIGYSNPCPTDSYGLPALSSTMAETTQLPQQFEALKVLEDLNLPPVPTFDPASPPRGQSQSQSQNKNSRFNKSKMRSLAT